MLTAITGNNLWQRQLSEGDEIVVERGILWLTFGANDIILSAGERLRIEADSLVMGQALKGDEKIPSAVFRLCQSASSTQTAGHFGRTFYERISFLRALHPLGRYRLSR